ncbi:MAG TPA: DMT family transporter [Actinomycetota bacterium]|nr:DMT family transporter [Actinomycetota bacterium]
MPDLLRLLALAAIWGCSYLFIKIALDGFTPLQIVGGRIAAGAVTLLTILWVRKISLPSDSQTWRRLLLMAVVANLLPFFLIAWGETYVSSALASILNSTTPLFTALFAAWLLPSERMNLMRAAGVALGFVGVGVVVGIESEGRLIAQLAIVGASFLYGIGFTYSKKYLTDTGAEPLSLPAAQLILGSALMVPLVGVESSAPSFGIAETAALGFLGVFGTGIALFLYYRLIRDVGPTTASFSTYLIPVFGVVAGRIVLDERLGWNALFGGLLVMAGLTLAERGLRRRALEMSRVG